ncbi:MAG TPA: tRNA epoxyqueuosine(34) reductase QueG [Sandaracinaceae bacterium LLY-WYZ-13_1]|nr:tRNA epoxyqueuosine(34) reductase QueG [Sandaracinaceae bacterium LLY-WYZ-13_1]
MSEELRRRLEARAQALGFARLGVARVEPLDREAEALRRWLARGHHASMGWMDDTAEVRLDPTHPGMLPGATRVVVLATSYARNDARQGPPPSVVAGYARGRDYHNVVGKRMRKLARLVRDEGHAARASVDSVPVLERAWAQRAGVGFVGKNCCLIVPGLGSHVFLSTLVTDAPLRVDAPMEERCGSCRRCLDACPTDAFVGARALDARRCLSYLTIEHRGPIDPALRRPLGGHLFGCDDCQDVCPFNRTAAPPDEATAPFAADPRLDVPVEALLEMNEDEHREWARGSPLRRPGREGLARNAALVLGNRGERRHLPALRRAAETDPSETVREAARWAVERIERRED